MKKRDYRRGIAIEMAIGLMLLVVALSIVLLTVSMLQIRNQASDLLAYEQKVLSFAVEDLTPSTVAVESDKAVTINSKAYTVKKKSETEYDISVGGAKVYTVTVDDGKMTFSKVGGQ